MLGVVIACCVMLCGLSAIATAAAIAAVTFWIREYRDRDVFQAKRLCITLKRNEGEFTGLLVEKRRNRWTFEQAQPVPTKAGMAIPEFEGRLHVDPRDMLFRQELPHANDQ